MDTIKTLLINKLTLTSNWFKYKISIIAFKPDALFGLQNSMVPAQLLNTDNKANRLHVNLKSLASLKEYTIRYIFNSYSMKTYLNLSINPSLYVKSQYGAAKQSNRTPAIFLVCGYSNRCNKTPTKLSAIRGLCVSTTFLVITETPPQTTNNNGFRTPISHNVAKHARNIRSTVSLSPNATKHRTSTGLIKSGDTISIFRINFNPCIRSSSFLSNKSKLRHTNSGNCKLLNICRSVGVFSK